MQKRLNSTRKTLSVDYLGTLSDIENGMSISKKLDGHAEIVVDTEIISVSDAIGVISNQVEISDLSVTGTSTEELVVSLYREFEI